MKTCPKCNRKLARKADKCVCGWDFTEDECPACDARIPGGSLSCPFCAYDLIGGGETETKAKSTKTQPEELPTVVVIPKKRLSPVRVPAAATVEKWPEWKFSGPVTDKSLLAWAEGIRRVAVSEGDHYMNVAIQYLAEYHDSPSLRKSADRLLKLLGGDDSH